MGSTHWGTGNTRVTEIWISQAPLLLRIRVQKSATSQLQIRTAVHRGKVLTNQTGRADLPPTQSMNVKRLFIFLYMKILIFIYEWHKYSRRCCAMHRVYWTWILFNRVYWTWILFNRVYWTWIIFNRVYWTWIIFNRVYWTWILFNRVYWTWILFNRVYWTWILFIFVKETPPSF
jgi:hypothetical protein